MALYRIFPTKDASIYSQSPTQNTGRDELLEIGGYPVAGVGNTVRSLIEFNTADISTVLSDSASISPVIHGGPFSASLCLSLCEAQELPASITINQLVVSQSWDEGLGKFGDTPVVTVGCSWTGSRQTGAGTVNWDADGGDTISSYNGINLTDDQAIIATNINSIGNDGALDLKFDVTNAVSQWASGSTPLANNGFLLKVATAYEAYTSASIRLKYYSKDTNTIYPPFLEIKWDDYSHSTGSLPELTDSDAVITIKNNKGEYKDQGKVRFRLHARPKYPTRTFTTSSAFIQNYYLPTASFWGIQDEFTEQMVVDYDTTFTKISCDSTSNYFDLYLDGIQPERYYRLLIKTQIDGSDIVVDNDQIFKVVRNG